MAEILSISIDLTKIDKSLIKETTRKDGSKAKFVDLTMFIADEQDNYGNIASISLSQTKEEREAKKPKVYIGNAKRTWAKKPEGQSTHQPQGNTNGGEPDETLPF